MDAPTTTAGTYLWVAALFALDVLSCRERRHTKSQVQTRAAARQTAKLDSRFCSEQKFLCGFRDLFFCLFLDRVSVVPSGSSSALLWHTVFLPSEARFCPLATGSLGLCDGSESLSKASRLRRAFEVRGRNEGTPLTEV